MDVAETEDITQNIPDVSGLQELVKLIDSSRNQSQGAVSSNKETKVIKNDTQDVEKTDAAEVQAKTEVKTVHIDIKDESTGSVSETAVECSGDQEVKLDEVTVALEPAGEQIDNVKENQDIVTIVTEKAACKSTASVSGYEENVCDEHLVHDSEHSEQPDEVESLCQNEDSLEKHKEGHLNLYPDLTAEIQRLAEEVTLTDVCTF